MPENAPINCAQANLHLPSTGFPSHCQPSNVLPGNSVPSNALPSSTVPSDDSSDYARAFLGLVDISLHFATMNATTTTTPEPDSLMSPETTILGLSVDTFSYILLGIGGVAPVLFLIIVAVSMKCYRHRQLMRARQREARLAVTRGLWELERKHYFSTHAKPPGYHGNSGATTVDSRRSRSKRQLPYMVQPPEAAHTFERNMSKRSSYASAQNVMISHSNPDVYFCETPVAPVQESTLFSQRAAHSHIRTTSLPGHSHRRRYQGRNHGNADSPGHYHGNGDSTDSQPVSLSLSHTPSSVSHEEALSVVARPAPRAPPSINSEEALVLQSFDRIYQDLDLDSASASATDSLAKTHSQSTYDKGSLAKTSSHSSHGGYHSEASTSSSQPATSRTNFRKLSRTNYNSRHKTVTVDMHYVARPDSRTAITEETETHSPDSSGSSSSSGAGVSQRPSTLPLLTHLHHDQYGRDGVRRTNTMPSSTSVSHSSSSAASVGSASGQSSSRGVGEGQYGASGSYVGYSNEAYEKQDTPDSPDVQITRL